MDGGGAERSAPAGDPEKQATQTGVTFTMARMGNYCRAYHARDFAAFSGWRPSPAELRPGAAGEARTALAEGDLLYLQEDFSVTDGIFLDEHVVFADAGPEWRAFCTGVLGFAPPAGAAAAPAEGAA
jgi:hypothetical protein